MAIVSAKYNANVITEESCDMQRYLIFVAHFVNFLALMLQVFSS